MKRVITIVFTGIYLLLSIGILAHIHLCHNVITDISITKESTCCSEESTCSNLHSDYATNNFKHESCCANEEVYFQFSENTSIPNIFTLKVFATFISNTFSDFSIVYTERTIEGYSITDFSPPPKVPLFRLYNSTLLYS